MFYETEIKVLDKDLVEVKTLYGDMQPYDKIINFEDDIELEIKHRVFCRLDVSLTTDNYFLIEGTMYKAMDVKKWSDHYEVLIYECKI